MARLPAPARPIARARPAAEGLGFTPAEFDSYDQGVYGWAEGSATGRQAITHPKTCL